MLVDVMYQGLLLMKGATARNDAGNLFIELEAPMPVGTRLEIVTPDGVHAARVERVVEGAGAGVDVKIASGILKSAEPNAPMAEMKSAPQVAEAEAPEVTMEAPPEDEEPEPLEPSSDSNGKKKRGKKPRKTVVGH